VLAARRLGGGGRGINGSCDGRLFEVTEISTTDDKMLMEEGGVAQHLLLQYLVVLRRDVGGLEKTPSKTPLALSVLALTCAPSANTTRTRAGTRTVS
jgi:hypothetical protein